MKDHVDPCYSGNKCSTCLSLPLPSLADKIVRPANRQGEEEDICVHAL